MARITENWLKALPLHVRADFNTGLLYWKQQAPQGGRRLNKPLGCKDSNGYIKVQILGVSTYAHLVIFFLYHGRWPSRLLDHKNRKPADNRPDNLEESTYSKNALNSKIWSTNTTGAKGVSVAPSGNYKVTKQGTYLGTFPSLEQAIGAYNKH